MGYKLAVYRDTGAEPIKAHLKVDGDYPGYAVAMNQLTQYVMELDPSCEWCVVGADDILPDPNHMAETIAAQCTMHFSGTFGCMQPTGDRWGSDASMPNCRPDRVAYIDRVCGSPWLGREFVMTMYEGNGPYFPAYSHMGVDEELQEVAEMLGVLWQRPDLTHLHNHWARERRKMPDYLKEANSPQHWNAYKRIFETRKAQGFPGARPVVAPLAL